MKNLELTKGVCHACGGRIEHNNSYRNFLGAKCRECSVKVYKIGAFSRENVEIHVRMRDGTPIFTGTRVMVNGKTWKVHYYQAELATVELEGSEAKESMTIMMGHWDMIWILESMIK